MEDFPAAPQSNVKLSDSVDSSEILVIDYYPLLQYV